MLANAKYRDPDVKCRECGYQESTCRAAYCLPLCPAGSYWLGLIVPLCTVLSARRPPVQIPPRTKVSINALFFRREVGRPARSCLVNLKLRCYFELAFLVNLFSKLCSFKRVLGLFVSLGLFVGPRPERGYLHTGFRVVCWSQACWPKLIASSDASSMSIILSSLKSAYGVQRGVPGDDS